MITAEGDVGTKPETVREDARRAAMTASRGALASVRTSWALLAVYVAFATAAVVVPTPAAVPRPLLAAADSS